MSRTRTSSSIVVILVALFALLMGKRPWANHQPGSPEMRQAPSQRPLPDSPPPVREKVRLPEPEGSKIDRPLPEIDSPVEAREVRRLLVRIDSGGPFLHRKDGALFRNAEGRLPRKPRGYYREYTVETPGSPDRGARRIIRGNGGETYYSNDHYRSFRKISGAD